MMPRGQRASFWHGPRCSPSKGARIFRCSFDDTIGSKLNRRVLVSGIKREKKDGTVVKDALDVVLLEGAAAGPQDELLPVPPSRW